MKRIIFLSALVFALAHQYVYSQSLSSQAVTKIDNLQYIENKLNSYGKAPVIVRLSIEMKNETHLKAIEKTNQRTKLRNLQDEVITQLDENTFTALKVFSLSPIISLHANSEAINRLSNLPAVEAIYPDRLSKPNLDISTVQIGADNVWSS